MTQVKGGGESLVKVVESAFSRHHGGEGGVALVLGSGGGHSAFVLTRTFQQASSMGITAGFCRIFAGELEDRRPKMVPY